MTVATRCYQHRRCYLYKWAMTHRSSVCCGSRKHTVAVTILSYVVLLLQRKGGLITALSQLNKST
jgi:hypothetical protein